MTPRGDNKAGKLTGETHRGNTPGEHSQKMKKKYTTNCFTSDFLVSRKMISQTSGGKDTFENRKKNNSVPVRFSNQVWDSAAKISMARERNQEIKGALERMWDSFPGK